jgi:spore coat protein U-like protein
MRLRSAIRLAAAGGVVGAAVACVLGAWGVHAATATATLSVSVTVAANCTVTTSALNFGSYDPVVANASSPLNGTGTVSVACTKGAAPTIGLNLGSNVSGSTRRLADGSGNFLDYEIYSDSTRLVVWTNTGAGLVAPGPAPGKGARNLTAYGQVPGNQDVPPGSYSDTVTATVNF